MMEWKRSSFDWNQARAFLVTAEEGSLSAAARALGLTQPTLSRQVAGLEDALGVTLFERTARALLLTQAGTELLEHFRGMGEAANRISIAATGQSESITGHVVIACTNGMATFFLPPILKTLRYRDPSCPPTGRQPVCQTSARHHRPPLCGDNLPRSRWPPVSGRRSQRYALCWV
jgi:DNA-binding transcriptional LysR family regulator